MTKHKNTIKLLFVDIKDQLLECCQNTNCCEKKV